MELHELADELRNASDAWLCHTGHACLHYPGGAEIEDTGNIKKNIEEIERRSKIAKANATDWELVHFAAYCRWCHEEADEMKILEAMNVATDLNSFWKHLELTFPHGDDCEDNATIND